MKLLLRLSSGDILPKYYGIAWRSANKVEIVCAIIPLNILLCLWIKLYRRLKTGFNPDIQTKAFIAGVDYGFDLHKRLQENKTKENIKSKIQI